MNKTLLSHAIKSSSVHTYHHVSVFTHSIIIRQQTLTLLTMISGNTAHDNDTRLSTPTEAAVTRRSRHDPRNQHGWRRIALNFQPAWFSANMGTGIASILLFNLPYNGRWLYWISVILFCLNVVLFLLFLSISIMRYTVFPGVWKAMLKDPTQAVYLGELTPFLYGFGY